LCGIFFGGWCDGSDCGRKFSCGAVGKFPRLSTKIGAVC
jgi:hypothetical protein